MEDQEKQWTNERLNHLNRRVEEVREALFRREDKDRGVPPGLIQLTTRIADKLDRMETRQDRQKTFVGGVVFAISAVLFFLTDGASKLLDFVLHYGRG